MNDALSRTTQTIRTVRLRPRISAEIIRNAYKPPQILFLSLSLSLYGHVDKRKNDIEQKEIAKVISCNEDIL